MMLDALRKDDTLVIMALTRLGRSVKEPFAILTSIFIQQLNYHLIYGYQYFQK